MSLVIHEGGRRLIDAWSDDDHGAPYALIEEKKRKKRRKRKKKKKRRDGGIDGSWTAARVAANEQRLRIVSGPLSGKTLAEVREDFRRRGVEVDEAEANKAMATAFNLCEAEGVPLMVVTYGPDGPELSAFELAAEEGDLD